MSNVNGQNRCDRCGADIGNAGLDKCVVISGIGEGGGAVLNLHLCTFAGRLDGAVEGTPDGERCASRVLTKAALADYVAHNGDVAVKFFTPEPPPPPPEPEPEPDLGPVPESVDVRIEPPEPSPSTGTV
jgi:hypothetical protein